VWHTHVRYRVTPNSGAALQVQNADAEDPWLQKAWGEVMHLQGRGQEGAVHMHVAAMLLLARLDQAASAKLQVCLSMHPTLCELLVFHHMCHPPPPPSVVERHLLVACDRVISNAYSHTCQ
jgi:hypothetical protein